MSNYQITASQLAALDALLREEVADAKVEAELKERKDARRASIEALMAEAGFDNKAVPGVTIQNRSDFLIDETAALAYALEPENFAHSAPLLSVRSDAVGVVIAEAMKNERLLGVFELNKTGYKAAARTGSHINMPIGAPIETRVIAISQKNIKTGDDLAAGFVVVADMLEAEAV